jgi:hypothetical protein
LPVSVQDALTAQEKLIALDLASFPRELEGYTALLENRDDIYVRLGIRNAMYLPRVDGLTFWLELPR